MTDNKYLDEKEKDLAESLKNIDIYNISKPTEKKQQIFKSAAREFRKKETKMDIRIDEFELEKIKECADSKELNPQSIIRLEKLHTLATPKKAQLLHPIRYTEYF